MVRYLLSILVSGLVLFANPLSACSVHDHNCAFHGIGRAVSSTINQNEPTAVYLITEGSNGLDFDAHAMLQDGHGPYIGSQTIFPPSTTNNAPYGSAEELPLHVAPGQYQVDFQNGTAQATHSGDLNGLNPVPNPPGCVIGGLNCEEIVIRGNIPNPQTPEGFVVNQTNHLYNVHNVPNPEITLTTYAVATGTAFFLNEDHLAYSIQLTDPDHAVSVTNSFTETLVGTGTQGTEITYNLGNTLFNPHAAGVVVHNDQTRRIRSSVYDVQYGHQVTLADGTVLTEFDAQRRKDTFIKFDRTYDFTKYIYADTGLPALNLSSQQTAQWTQTSGLFNVSVNQGFADFKTEQDALAEQIKNDRLVSLQIEAQKYAPVPHAKSENIYYTRGLDDKFYIQKKTGVKLSIYESFLYGKGTFDGAVSEFNDNKAAYVTASTTGLFNSQMENAVNGWGLIIGVKDVDDVKFVSPFSEAQYHYDNYARPLFEDGISRDEASDLTYSIGKGIVEDARDLTEIVAAGITTGVDGYIQQNKDNLIPFVGRPRNDYNYRENFELYYGSANELGNQLSDAAQKHIGDQVEQAIGFDESGYAARYGLEIKETAEILILPYALTRRTGKEVDDLVQDHIQKTRQQIDNLLPQDVHVPNPKVAHNQNQSIIDDVPDRPETPSNPQTDNISQNPSRSVNGELNGRKIEEAKLGSSLPKDKNVVKSREGSENFGLNATNRGIDKILVDGGVPTSRSDFDEWAADLSSDDIKQIWSDSELRGDFKDMIRPGRMHEWCMCEHYDQFSEWGLSVDEVRAFSTATGDLKWTVPDDVPDIGGQSGGHISSPAHAPFTGSTTFHNELSDLIINSPDLDSFYDSLPSFADRWSIDPNLLPLRPN